MMKSATGMTEQSQSIEWFSEGQTRYVEVEGIRVAIRLVARKGRRSRIAITAPAGAMFIDADPNYHGCGKEC